MADDRQGQSEGRLGARRLSMTGVEQAPIALNNMRKLIAPVMLALCVSVHAQDKWDLEKCRDAQATHPGHLCTQEHLDADLAVLTAEYAAIYDNHEFRS